MARTTQARSAASVSQERLKQIHAQWQAANYLAAAQIYLRFLQSLAGKNVPLTSVPVPKSVQDYLIAGGSGGWVGLGSTNPNTGQPEWPNPLSLGTELLPFLTFLADPVNWERIGFVALGLLAGTAGFVLYVRGHSGVRTA